MNTIEPDLNQIAGQICNFNKFPLNFILGMNLG